MKSPSKNRLHDYEAGLLTLVRMRVITEKEARGAMSRVAQKAIDDMEACRERRRKTRQRRRRKH
jgi:hypothetical protein